MIVFHSDLDNTIIYSYKRDIGEDKKCVEVYEGREISFVTKRTQELLEQVHRKMLFVPTTTRTSEQYNRISLGIGEIPYALVCNGGVLLVNGQEDEAWYQESLELTEESRPELYRAIGMMEADKNRSFEVRNIKDLFVFTKSTQPLVSVEWLKEKLNTNLVDVFYTGVKVYVVPKMLSKGNAVERFRKKVCGNQVIAAGDSEFDLSMAGSADVTMIPENLYVKEGTSETVVVMKESLFSEQVLAYALKLEAEAGGREDCYE